MYFMLTILRTKSRDLRDLRFTLAHIITKIHKIHIMSNKNQIHLSAEVVFVNILTLNVCYN